MYDTRMYDHVDATTLLEKVRSGSEVYVASLYDRVIDGYCKPEVHVPANKAFRVTGACRMGGKVLFTVQYPETSKVHPLSPRGHFKDIGYRIARIADYEPLPIIRGSNGGDGEC